VVFTVTGSTVVVDLSMKVKWYSIRGDVLGYRTLIGFFARMNRRDGIFRWSVDQVE